MPRYPLYTSANPIGHNAYLSLSKKRMSREERMVMKCFAHWNLFFLRYTSVAAITIIITNTKWSTGANSEFTTQHIAQICRLIFHTANLDHTVARHQQNDIRHITRSKNGTASLAPISHPTRITIHILGEQILLSTEMNVFLEPTNVYEVNFINLIATSVARILKNTSCGRFWTIMVGQLSGRELEIALYMKKSVNTTHLLPVRWGFTRGKEPSRYYAHPTPMHCPTLATKYQTSPLRIYKDMRCVHITRNRRNLQNSKNRERAKGSSIFIQCCLYRCQ